MAFQTVSLAFCLSLPPDRQNVEIKLLDVKKGECIAGTPIPLNAPRLTLRWIGFSDLVRLVVAGNPVNLISTTCFLS